MKGTNDIEKLFKEGFESFKPDVNPSLWNNIQSSLNAPTGSGSEGGASSSSAGGSGGGIQSLVQSTKFWIAASVTTAAVVTTTILINQDSKKEDKLITSVQENEKNSIPDVIEAEQVVLDENRENNNQGEGALTPTDGKDKQSGEDEMANLNEASDNTTTITSNHQQVTNSVTENKKMESSNTTVKTVQSETKKTEGDIVEEKKEEQISINKNISIIQELAQTGIEEEQTFKISDAKHIKRVNWYIDGINKSQNLDFNHTFQKEGVHMLEAEVIFSNGETKTISKEVEAVAPSFLSKGANVFTPAGDGINDVFKVESKNIKQFKIIIFDTNNNIVFTSESPNFKWDGRSMSGESLPEGNYRYIIRATGKDGVVHTESEVLQLRR